MASPDTRSSTLRFCWRPAELSFEATGSVAETSGADRVGGYTLLYEIGAHGIGTILGQLLVHVIAADIIRVSADLNVESRRRQQDTGNLRQLLPCSWLQGILSAVKQYVGHANDEPTCAVASLKNGIQLFGQTCPHGGFVGVRLVCC
jgi:hypothetical protein